jgi:hypothetical protein
MSLSSLFRQGDTAKFSVCRELSIAQTHSRFKALVRREFEVHPKLAIEVVVLGLAPAPEAEISHGSRCSARSSL